MKENNKKKKIERGEIPFVVAAIIGILGLVFSVGLIIHSFITPKSNPTNDYFNGIIVNIEETDEIDSVGLVSLRTLRNNFSSDMMTEVEVILLDSDENQSTVEIGDVIRLSLDDEETEFKYHTSSNWKILNDLKEYNYADFIKEYNLPDKYSKTIQSDDIPVNTKESHTVIITKIYNDCFMAENAYPLPVPAGYKINGELPRKYCVGDYAEVEADNMYVAEDKYLVGDMVNIKDAKGPDPNMCYKPVIYLYPEKKTDVSVSLELKNGDFTCTYPRYTPYKGWEITADENGVITGKNGKEYNYLYWEGTADMDYDMSKGFCIAGSETAEFLEEVLPKLGLNRKEANEFIVYWLPQMQKNNYNLISFQSSSYADAVKLNVTPTPDTMIRIYMTYMGLDEKVDVAPQNITTPERTGFTVVEWGGSEIKEENGETERNNNGKDTDFLDILPWMSWYNGLN